MKFWPARKKPPAIVILRNLPSFLLVMARGPARILAMLHDFDRSRHDKEGHHMGRAQMLIGLLHKTKKRRPLALRHLSEARWITALHGPSPMLVRIDTALAELG